METEESTQNIKSCTSNLQRKSTGEAPLRKPAGVPNPDAPSLVKQCPFQVSLPKGGTRNSKKMRSPSWALLKLVYQGSYLEFLTEPSLLDWTCGLLFLLQPATLLGKQQYRLMWWFTFSKAWGPCSWAVLPSSSLSVTEFQTHPQIRGLGGHLTWT